MVQTKKVFGFLAAALLAGTSCVTAFAENDAKSLSVTLRIEGISENLYYDTVEIPYTTENLTVQDALIYIDNQSDDITITGADIAWITDINGDLSGTFGGWDGWLYTVNNTEPSVGVDGYILEDNDSVVLYYGDPYGVGMQYPKADVSDIANGVLTFTSENIVYDENFNSSVVASPVTDATVKWFYTTASKDGTEVISSAVYITDKDGKITVDKSLLTEGEHHISIERTNESGLPTVLRFADDYTITVTAVENSDVEESSTDSETDNDTSTEETSINDTPDGNSTSENTGTELSTPLSPSTGDGTSSVILGAFAVSALTLAVCLMNGKKKNEK